MSEPIKHHKFEAGYSGMVCEKMVMRNGGGDSCGEPADAEIHNTMDESTRKLVAALEEHGNLEPVVQNARASVYHDFKSKLAFPTIALCSDLHAHLANRTLIQRVVNGEFDATQAEADAWANSKEGRGTFRELLGIKINDVEET